MYAQHELEDDVMELRRQDIEQLKKRMTSLVQEKQMLVKNIGDAEAALRTLARYEATHSPVVVILTGSSVRQLA